MKKTPMRLKLLIISFSVCAVAAAIYFGLLYRTTTIVVDGQDQQVRGVAVTVGQILRIAGIPLAYSDEVSPAVDQWVVFSHPTIKIERAAQVSIVHDGQTTSMLTTERLPDSLLAQAKVILKPGDEILINGMAIDPGQPLPYATAHVLQIRRADQIVLNENGLDRTISSTAATLGQALWQAGIRLAPEDSLTLKSPQVPIVVEGRGDSYQQFLQVPLSQTVSLSLVRAVPLSIIVDGQITGGNSSSPTVGQALADVGISLEGMDYSIPAETSAVPEDGQIRVVRVREDVVLQQETTPFGSSYKPDPNTELDQRSVLVPGLLGIEVSRVRIRYEDGKEIARQTEAQWQAQAPQDEVIGYGTKVVIRTEVVDGVTISYWRKAVVYATSYSPCTQGYDHCTTGTASGIPLRKGIIAVTVDWYHIMAFQQVFIPGYGTGTIADTSGGIPGTPFMDLGFSESDFQPWYNWTVVYFLTPVPAYIPWTLQ